MSTQLKTLRGIAVLGLLSAIFLAVVQRSVTSYLMLVGLICMLAGASSDWRDWRSLQRAFPETYREALAGRLPRRAPWETALSVIGFGLFVLSLWRAWSGLR